MRKASRIWIAPQHSALFRSAANAISQRYLQDEAGAVRALCERARIDDAATQEVLRNARALTSAMRARAAQHGVLDSFLTEYDLSSHEGVVLMCLAEALLRIPDAETADRLIADKLADAQFHEHLGRSDDLLVNVGTWGLILCGRIHGAQDGGEAPLEAVWSRMLARIGEPLVRQGLRSAMRIVSDHFVMGQTIERALERAADARDYDYSFDMLGEAALTSADADDYFEKYSHAIRAIARGVREGLSTDGSPGISIKLSALSPRFEPAHADALASSLVPRLRSLVAAAMAADVMVTIDAEEADRLEPTLFVFESVLRTLPAATDGRFGLAVQAYQKRGIAVVEWLDALARSVGTSIPVRLVKGAYWDTEIKLAQQRGLEGFPVFTRKTSTDVSYLACANAMFAASGFIYPQFATHNPHTVTWLLERGAQAPFEFQRLHGMGEELYESVGEILESKRPCRVYAPVGLHNDLLPYLVRRLLENGANSSFVNRFVDAQLDVEDLIRDPLERTLALEGALANPRIRLPADLFGETRRNSEGLNLADPASLQALAERLAGAGTDANACTDTGADTVADTNGDADAVVDADANAGADAGAGAAAGIWRAVPLVRGQPQRGESLRIDNPAYAEFAAGYAELATPQIMRQALDAACDGFAAWNATPARQRAQCLRATADSFERARAELVAICVTEGGRTVADALAEVREAVDFLRYYANAAEAHFGVPEPLPGPTGESNTLRMLGRGVFVCISPWNFPVAIFTGQIAAALAAGNTVIAKPAEQTPLVAARIVRLFFEAGIPASALQFLPAAGSLVGETVLPDPRIAGIAFTGSTDTAKRIERTLAAREGPVAALIAETGGINAMIVDSSALAEQVVRDAAMSAFNSAGQRCSALRLLCIQSDVADGIIEMLIGRMRELVIGDPAELATDVGPIIDDAAREALRAYVGEHERRVLYRCAVESRHAVGCYFPPTLLELDDVSQLTREVFGPVLHVVRFDADNIDALLNDLNGLGYGLTLGVQSRVSSFARLVEQRMRVGNIYVNRDMIGAAVGVQPFGGLGLSGTGPKAGGPHYLARFGVEQTMTVNTAAIGGNVDLLGLAE